MKQNRETAGLTGRKLKRLLHQLCERAQEDVRRMSTHEESATHQLRVRVKKIMALLRLANPGIEKHTLQAMRKHLRAVKNACAGNRDHVVQGRLIDKLTRRFHLAAKHRPQLMGQTLKAPPVSGLHHQLYAFGQLIDSTCIQSLTEEQILEQHARCYRKGRHLMKQAFETKDKRTLHRWRHRVKDLYYQSLVLPHLRGCARRIRRARRLGQLLGRDHDLANLATEPAFAMRRSPWVQVIHEHRERLRERYLSLGHRLYSPPCTRFSGKILHSA
ncbi:MAG: CHAD domain-containing protein [Verrucomicrobia bacterium]|nr:CHAD domain-containing protein [Verrucomicrobiota bacterium]